MFPDPATAGAPPAAPDQAAPQKNLEDAVPLIRELLRTIVEADGTVSEQERLKVEKIMTAVQELAATREKETQAALGGGTGGINAVARAIGGV